MNPYNHNPFRIEQDIIRAKKEQRSEYLANKSLSFTHKLITQELLALRKIVK